jgi:hypothetical protein
MQRTTTQGSGPGLENAMETLNISPDQVQEGGRASDQHHGRQAGSQHSAQIDGAPTGKASDEEVWYLKSIEFTSPSGETRTYNVITQNYNGCVVCHTITPLSWLVACPDVQDDGSDHVRSSRYAIS